MPHSAIGVANEFLDRGFREKVALTPMHLQKLCYMAHGFSLAFLGRPLIGASPDAWAYGPVYEDLYNALKGYGSGPVTELIRENNWAVVESIRGDVVRELFAEDETIVIDQVFDAYARYPAFKLSALTHEAGSPWEQIYRQGVGRNAPIPNDKMRDYFRGLATAS